MGRRVSWIDQNLVTSYVYDLFMYWLNVISRAPSKEEYFSVDAKDVEMQNMNASGPRRPEGGVKAGQQQQQGK